MDSPQSDKDDNADEDSTDSPIPTSPKLPYGELLSLLEEVEEVGNL